MQKQFELGELTFLKETLSKSNYRTQLKMNFIDIKLLKMPIHLTRTTSAIRSGILMLTVAHRLNAKPKLWIPISRAPSDHFFPFFLKNVLK